MIYAPPKSKECLNKNLQTSIVFFALRFPSVCIKFKKKREEIALFSALLLVIRFYYLNIKNKFPQRKTNNNNNNIHIVCVPSTHKTEKRKRKKKAHDRLRRRRCRCSSFEGNVCNPKLSSINRDRREKKKKRKLYVMKYINHFGIFAACTID
jgi:hypothetical protein